MAKKKKKSEYLQMKVKKTAKERKNTVINK